MVYVFMTEIIRDWLIDREGMKMVGRYINEKNLGR